MAIYSEHDEEEYDVKVNKLVDFAKDNPRKLSTWEIDFIDTIENWEHSFSDKQLETIDNLMEKL